jgi:hypothetical protein
MSCIFLIFLNFLIWSDNDFLMFFNVNQVFALNTACGAIFGPFALFTGCSATFGTGVIDITNSCSLSWWYLPMISVTK